MANVDTASSELPNRKFQFRLWQLMVAITAVCIAAGTIHWFSELIIFVLLAAFPIIVLGSALSAVFLAFGRYQRALEALVVTLCAGIFTALLLPSVGYGPGPSRRSQCQNNLLQIGIALQNYHDDYGRFPPVYIADKNGRPMHSWRVLLLPYVEQKPLYDLYRFDEPWDGPNNRKLADTILKIYSCPSDTNPSPTETSYVAVVGRETAWPGEKSTNAKAITDGMSNTILVVEVHHSGIHWMEPRDLSMTQMPMAINPERGTGMCSLHPNGAQAVFCDGSVHYLSDEIPPETLRALLTANAGDDASGEW